MFSVLFFIVVFNFQPTFAPVTCNQNKKIKYGNLNQVDCPKFCGCYDSQFGCYFSQENIPGFRMMRGECTSCTTDLILSNLEREECARECLKRQECNCFMYDSSSKGCEIKYAVCRETNFADNGKITYNRYASKKIACTYGDCVGNDVVINGNDPEDCSNNCKDDSRCKLITLASKADGNTLCFVKDVRCDFTLLEKFDAIASSCLLGPIFPDWFTNHESNGTEIKDNLTSTCKSVGLADNFNLKIPWPTIGQASPYFNISIIGTNLQKCIDSEEALYTDGVIAFVVYEFQPTFQFTGNFKACKPITGNDKTECKYSCFCGMDYCEAVHIRAFASGEVNMSICHYQILGGI